MDRLQSALESAEAEVAEERDRIAELIRDLPEEDAERAWNEERSVLLRYLEDEVRVAETNLLLREARGYHLTTPNGSDKFAWYTSQLRGGKFLTNDAKRELQRQLLAERRDERDENRKEAEAKRASRSLGIAIFSLTIAGIALLKDVPIGDFLVDLVEALRSN